MFFAPSAFTVNVDAPVDALAYLKGNTCPAT